MNSLKLLIIVLSSTLLFSSRETPILQLTVTGLKDTKGQIMIGVYDNAADFPDHDKTVKRFLFRLSDKELSQVVLKINGLSIDKRYALAVYHDKNANNKLDKNIFGAPTEMYGFSNNARATFGPPSFDDASIVLSGSLTKHEIHLK